MQIPLLIVAGRPNVLVVLSPNKYFPDVWTDPLRVVVKAAFRPPSPYGWFIYKESGTEPIESSETRFRSLQEAFSEGSAALSGRKKSWRIKPS